MMMNPEETMTLPADQWERLTDMYSAMAATEQDSKNKSLPPARQKLVAVKVGKIGDTLYTSFGMCHGGLEYSCIDAWELCQESLYTEATHVLYHDSDVIETGLRALGDHRGLLVSNKGKHYVLTRLVQIRMSLPSPASAITLSDAQDYDRAESRYGWRALWCKGTIPAWRMLAGFPVATYHSTSGPPCTLTMLHYRLGKRIVELRLNHAERLERVSRAPSMRAAVSRAMRLRSGRTVNSLHSQGA
jgi:hypothetical protein